LSKQEKMLILEATGELSIRKQAKLLQIPRTKLYYKPVVNDESELANLIREVYLWSDCRYGYRKIAAHLRQEDRVVNAKKVLRIMHEIGIEGLYPKNYVHTSRHCQEAINYPYLLTDLAINRIDQVWASDITYIKINGGYMYFTAILDLYSRYVISYELSH
jgi:putative transposase